jgi:Na+/melibiose symporter-like transporter
MTEESIKKKFQPIKLLKKGINDYRTSDLGGKKMSFKEFVSYGFSEFSAHSLYMILDTYFYMFLTQVLRVPPLEAGLFVTVNRIFEIIRDPIAAVIIDRTRTKKWGRFKPYIMLFAGPLAAVSIMFYFNAGATMDARITFAYITFLAAGLFRAFHQMGWAGLQNSLSNDSDEKGKYFTIGAFGRIFAGTLPGFIPLILGFAPYFGINIRIVFIICAVLFCSVGVVATIFVKNLRERVILPKTENPLKSIKKILANRYLWLIWTDKIGMILVHIGWTVQIWVFWYVFGNIALQSVMWTVTSVPTFFMAAFAPWVFKRMHPSRFVIVHNLLQFACFGIMFFFGFSLFGGGLGGMIPLLILSTLAAFTSRIREISGQILTTDCLDYLEVKTGQRYEATVSATSSLLDKGTLAFVGILTGALLTFIGFQPGTRTQSPATLNGIWVIYCWAIAGGHLLSAIPYFFYKLRGDKQKRIKDELLRRKQILEDGGELIIDYDKMRTEVLLEKPKRNS